MNKNWKMSVVTAAVAGLVACGEELPEMEGENGEGNGEEVVVEEGDTSTLVVGMTNAPDSLNVFNRPGVPGGYVQRFLYNSLLEMPEADRFEPGLANHFETEDNQTFTVEMNEEAYWTDGEPVTAHDVAFTLNYIADPEVETSLGSRVSMIEGTDSSGVLEKGVEELSGVEVQDDYTLTIETKEPVDLNFISEFVGFDILIAPQHVFEDLEKTDIATSEEATNPSVFSGPYQLEEYDEDNYVRLTRNEEYFKGSPEIEEVYLNVMSNQTMVTEFLSGNVHMAAGGGVGTVSRQDLDMLREEEGFVVEDHPTNSVQYMVVNNERFEDPRVRQAFIHAINRELIVDEVLYGYGEVVAATHSSLSPYQHEDLEPLAYDPEQAEALLEEADWDFDEEIELLVRSGNDNSEMMGDLIQQNLLEVGLNVTQANFDFPTMLDRALEGGMDFGLFGFNHTVDPDQSTYFRSGASQNIARIEDDRVDELLDEGMSATTFEERDEIYGEFQEHFQEEAFVVPLYSESTFAVQVEELNGGVNEYWRGSLHDVHEWTLDP